MNPQYVPQQPPQQYGPPSGAGYGMAQGFSQMGQMGTNKPGAPPGLFQPSLPTVGQQQQQQQQRRPTPGHAPGPPPGMMRDPANGPALGLHMPGSLSTSEMPSPPGSLGQGPLGQGPAGQGPLRQGPPGQGPLGQGPPGQGIPGPGLSNTGMGHSSMQQTFQSSMTQPPVAPNANQITNQLAGINLRGPPRISSPNSGFSSGPVKSSVASGGFTSAVNGGPPSQQNSMTDLMGSLKMHPSESQYMNGSMGPPPPGGGPLGCLLQDPPQSPLLGSPQGPLQGPPQGPMQGLAQQPGGMPALRSNVPSMPPHGGMLQPVGMPPQGGVLPPPGGMPLPGGMPPPLPHTAATQATMPGVGRMLYSQPGAPPSVEPYPSMAGGPLQSHSFSQPQAQLQAQPQARRLDPDQMPSPIQVMQDDQRNRSGVFYTSQKGQVPPLVTTNFITQDQGNAGPHYIRSTMYNVPATIDMMKQTAVPLGLVLSPLARPMEGEYPPPIVDMGELGPVRCIRCKAYMCPFMQFIDGGRRFHCLFCKATTEVSAEYFQHLDHTGQRVDRYERPELMLGTYEFVATKDYCRNNTFPKPPALIFLIDVSYNNIKSGMVHLLCREMKEILKLLPRDAGAEKNTMKVGFITYNNTVHFYNIKSCLAQPQMMVVGDVHDMFMPLLEGFLCDPEESEAVIDSLMEQIPTMFAETRETETVLAPAIQAGLEALKASECAGKLLVFHSSLPIAEAPGKLKNRDERKLLGTEKEKTVLAPQLTIYNNLGQECVGAGCSVDLFIFNNSYIDLATIGQVSRLTGGEVFKYTYFQADLDGERLIADIKRDVSRPVAFDAIMRVRTSTGVRATDFFGHFFMSNTTDMELGSIDCDKAVAVEIKHDDKLTEEDGVYVQVALLYTSCGGQRRLRVLNLSFKTCTQMADLYRSCDLDSIVNFFSKQVVYRLLESSPKQVKDGLVNRCAQMLACYRKNCASPSSAGQLILPECMKLLPLYVNCILKSDAVSGGSDMTIDDRSFVMQAVSIMDVPSSVVYFYPRLLPLHEVDINGNEVPAPIRCTADKIRDDGVYLLENGVHMFLWIGLNVSMEWVQSVFGVNSAAQIDIDRTALPDLDNPLSQRIAALIACVRQQRHRSMRLTLVRQRDKLEMVFKHFLVEDRGFDGSASYVDFLCHMHKEIRNLLS